MKKRILLIDDDVNIRKTVSQVLGSVGYEVITASDGMDGMARFSDGIFDLVYTEILSSQMDGFEVLKAIREQCPDLPVVILSSDYDGNIYLRAVALGATDYLLKPIKPETLIERTRNFLLDFLQKPKS